MSLCLSLKCLCTHQLFFITVSLHFSIHHLFSFIIVFFFTIHLLHVILELFACHLCWLAITTILLVIDTHVLLICMHLHQQLLVLLFIQFIHFFLAFTFISVLFFIFVPFAMLSPLSFHHLLNFLVSFSNILLFIIFVHFISRWGLSFLLLLL